MKDMVVNAIKTLSSKKFFSCLFSVLILGIMGIWCLYKLPEALALQAFIGTVGAITAVFVAFCTGNVVGDHFGKK